VEGAAQSNLNGARTSGEGGPRGSTRIEHGGALIQVGLRWGVDTTRRAPGELTTFLERSVRVGGQSEPKENPSGPGGGFKNGLAWGEDFGVGNGAAMK